MPTTILTTNMKCQSCLGKVARQLEADPRVRRWDADLSDPRKVLRIEHDAAVPPEDLVAKVAAAGFTAQEVAPEVPVGERSLPVLGGGATEVRSQPADVGSQTAEVEANPETSFSLATYKPLLLVLAYVLGATAFAESIHGEFLWPRAMHYFMGFFFLGFAFFKLLNVAGFADAFSSYDILARRSRAYAVAYPFVELALGLAFLSQRYLVVANAATLVVMLVGLIGVVAAVRRRQTIQCACLGTVFNLPMSRVTIIENSLMAAMAAGMLVHLAG